MTHISDHLQNPLYTILLYTGYNSWSRQKVTHESLRVIQDMALVWQQDKRSIRRPSDQRDAIRTDWYKALFN